MVTLQSINVQNLWEFLFVPFDVFHSENLHIVLSCLHDAFCSDQTFIQVTFVRVNSASERESTENLSIAPKRSRLLTDLPLHVSSFLRRGSGEDARVAETGLEQRDEDEDEEHGSNSRNAAAQVFDQEGTAVQGSQEDKLVMMSNKLVFTSWNQPSFGSFEASGSVHPSLRPWRRECHGFTQLTVYSEFRGSRCSSAPQRPPPTP